MRYLGVERHCHKAGEPRRTRILAPIDQPKVPRAILDCLRLISRAPPLAPASLPEPIDLELGLAEPWPAEAG